MVIAKKINIAMQQTLGMAPVLVVQLDIIFTIPDSALCKLSVGTDNI
jgi:hypothetical protein